jgi:hypothetical protein
MEIVIEESLQTPQGAGQILVTDGPGRQGVRHIIQIDHSVRGTTPFYHNVHVQIRQLDDVIANPIDTHSIRIPLVLSAPGLVHQLHAVLQQDEVSDGFARRAIGAIEERHATVHLACVFAQSGPDDHGSR